MVYAGTFEGSKSATLVAKHHVCPSGSVMPQMRSPQNWVCGSTVTVEPGVYLPDRGGVRIEDTLAVGAKGPELLTRFPKDLTILGN